MGISVKMQVNEINKNQGLNKTSKTTKSSPTTGTSFSAYLEESMKTQTTPLEASGNIAATDALLAAQMVEGDEKKEQNEKLGKSLDILEKKFGRNIVRTGFVNKEVPFKQGFLTSPQDVE